jgi:hypothetical protein
MQAVLSCISYEMAQHQQFWFQHCRWFNVYNTIHIIPVVITLLSKCFKFLTAVLQISGLGSVFGIVTGYGLDGPGIESWWVRDFPRLSRPAHPASCTMGTGSFLGVKSGWGMTLTPHPLQVPWSRKGRAIPLRVLPIWAIRPVQSLSACTRVVHFTFTLCYKYVCMWQMYWGTECSVRGSLSCGGLCCGLSDMSPRLGGLSRLMFTIWVLGAAFYRFK